jgi:2-dehydropantoate 2-reductase
VKIVIWGAGAVGLGLASALANSSENSDDRLRILGRNAETLALLETRGITRTGFFGKAHVAPSQLEIANSTGTLIEDPPDWLLVCTKAFSSVGIASALEPIAQHLVERTRLLLCQNGWGNELPFLSFWPKPRLFHARIITGFQLRSPTEVEITAHAAPIALGSVFGASPDCLVPLAQRFSEGGISAETTDDMRGVLWAKMLYNCALNPLGAIAGRRYGELVDSSTTRALLEEIVREIFVVLDAAGERVAWPNAAAYLETLYSELIPPTAAHESSMLQDLRAQRPTEIEALCGAVEHLASEHEIATPVVSALAELVRVAERSAARSARFKSTQPPRRSESNRSSE